jgi:hypothetical protein
MCKKGFLNKSFSPYFDFNKELVFVNNYGEISYIIPLKDTITSFGEAKKFFWLDEEKLLFKSGNFVYEIYPLSVDYPEPFILDKIGIPFFPFLPIDRDNENFSFRKIYIKGTDTVEIYVNRDIETKRNGEFYTIKIQEEIHIGSHIKKTETLLFIESKEGITYIKKGGEEWWLKKN